MLDRQKTDDKKLKFKHIRFFHSTASYTYSQLTFRHPKINKPTLHSQLLLWRRQTSRDRGGVSHVGRNFLNMIQSKPRTRTISRRRRSASQTSHAPSTDFFYKNHRSLPPKNTSPVLPLLCRDTGKALRLGKLFSTGIKNGAWAYLTKSKNFCCSAFHHQLPYVAQYVYTEENEETLISTV